MRKRGPKAQLPNPRPVTVMEIGDNGPVRRTEEIHPRELEHSASELRAYFGRHREELVRKPGETLESAMRRITQLAADALEETGAVAWSGYGIEQVDPASVRRLSRPWGRGGARRHVGPEPPAKAEHGCLWLDTATKRIKRYHKRVRSWERFCAVDAPDALFTETVTVLKRGKQFRVAYPRAEALLTDLCRPASLRRTSWLGVTRRLRDLITRMLRNEADLAGKDGRPAYLAYATLAVLLDVTPEKIRNTLDNFSHPRRLAVH